MPCTVLDMIKILVKWCWKGLVHIIVGIIPCSKITLKNKTDNTYHSAWLPPKCYFCSFFFLHGKKKIVFMVSGISFQVPRSVCYSGWQRSTTNDTYLLWKRNGMFNFYLKYIEIFGSCKLNSDDRTFTGKKKKVSDWFYTLPFYHLVQLYRMGFGEKPILYFFIQSALKASFICILCP